MLEPEDGVYDSPKTLILQKLQSILTYVLSTNVIIIYEAKVIFLQIDLS